MDWKIAPLSRRGAIAGGAAALAGGMFLSPPRRASGQDQQAAGGTESDEAAAAEGRREATGKPAPGLEAPRRKSADAQGRLYSEKHWDEPGMPGVHYRPVVTPNGWTLPFKVVDGIKVFHMTCDVVPRHEFVPKGGGFDGLYADCWGYNGGVHGPTIEVVEGDRIRIYVTNRLPAPTSVHWHGLLLPNGMDGVAGLNQPVIKPGETCKYEFTIRQHGTHMYHSHHDEMTQMALGMLGLFIIHPRHLPKEKWPDRDFAFMLSEWKIVPGTYRPDPNEMSDFNILTFNARAFPGTAPMVAKLNDRVRIRIANLSAMDNHPIHLHGYQFPIVETDGGQIPESAQQMETTMLTGVGQARVCEFIADEPGDWAMHCHMTHHVMNHMGHELPNMIGVQPGDLDERVQQLVPAYMTMGQDGMGDMGDMGMEVPENSIPMVGGQGPFDYITMGGMFTVLKVHPDLENYDDPGWYKHPEGEVAMPASADEMRRDGIAADGSTAPVIPASARRSPGHTEPTRGQAEQEEHSARGQRRGSHAGHGAQPAGDQNGTRGGGEAGAPTGAAKAVGTAAYVCPMHKKVTSARPGKCPICKMKLKPAARQRQGQ